MRLDLLLARNGFEKIFNTTLFKYLNTVSSWDGKISWDSPIISTTAALTAFPKINIIAGKSIDKKTIISWGMEYGYHQNHLRRVLQSFYIKNIFNFPIAIIDKKYLIKVEPWTPTLDEIFIIPGNHSLRIMDLSKHISIVIPYPAALGLIRNQVEIRSTGITTSAPQKFCFFPQPLWDLHRAMYGLRACLTIIQTATLWIQQARWI